MASARKKEPGAMSSGGKGSEAETSNAIPTPAPAWSELKTKAGKERKRLPLACKSCRRKKVRCSGETPSCKHCLRARIPCVYKVTQRKATPRTDYMTMLDKRLKRMEERVIKSAPNSEAVKVSAIGRASVRPSNAEKSKTFSKKRAATEAFAPSESDDHARLQAHSFKDKSETSSLMEGVEHLPPSDVQEHLAETYFDVCYGQPYHLLHKPSFMRRLRAGTIPPVLMLAVCSISSRFSTHSYFAGEAPSLRGDQWAHEARKIASRSFGEPNMTIVIVVTLLALYDFGSCQGGRAWMYAGIAMRMCYALGLNQEHHHEPGEGPDPNGPQGKPEKRDKLLSGELSFTDQEIRRRTMWACFLMDCFNSSGTKRPAFDHIPHITIQLPIKEHLFQSEVPGQTEDVYGNPGNAPLPGGEVSNNKPKENMGVAAYLVKILVLWGRVVTYTNSGRMHEDPRPPWDPDSDFVKLKMAVDRFWRDLPTHLQYAQENIRTHEAQKLANQFAFMHIVYQQIVLFLHKFTIPAFPGAKIPPQMPDGFRREARQAALKAAVTISSILDQCKEGQLTAPFASYCTFASSTVHIWGVFSGNKELQERCKASLSVNMHYLFRMKKYWSMVHYMTESVKDIYKTHADAVRPNLIDRAKSAEEGFFEYGDMQDREHPAAVDDDGCKHPQSPKSKRYTQLSAKPDLKNVGDWFKEKSQSPKLLSADIPNRPAKRGKSLHYQSGSVHGHARNPNTPPAQSGIPISQGVKLDAMSMGNTPTPPDTTPNAYPQHHTPHSMHNTQSPPAYTDHPSTTSQFAPVSNPYQDLNFAATFVNATGSGTGPNGNAFFARLPMQAYDRQLVYGAYVQDPTLAFGNPFEGSAGDANGQNTFGGDHGAGFAGTGAVNPGIAAHLGLNPQHTMGGSGMGNGVGFGDASAAWLTPFHLVPPINLVQPEFTGSGQGDGVSFGNGGDNIDWMGGMDFGTT